MSIESYDQLVALRHVGRICHLALAAMARFIRPGVTTLQIADVGAKVMRENGARSAPAMVYGFPGEICISVNDEAVHGIPGSREIQPGDLVKLEVTFEKNGYMGDAAITVPVDPATDGARFRSSHARREGRSSRQRNWPRRGARSPAQRLFRRTRALRTRNRPHDSRGSHRAQFYRCHFARTLDVRPRYHR